MFAWDTFFVLIVGGLSGGARGFAGCFFWCFYEKKFFFASEAYFGSFACGAGRIAGIAGVSNAINTVSVRAFLYTSTVEE